MDEEVVKLLKEIKDLLIELNAKIEQPEIVKIELVLPRKVYEQLDQKRIERKKPTIVEVIQEAIAHYLLTSNLDELPLDEAVKDVFTD